MTMATELSGEAIYDGLTEKRWQLWKRTPTSQRRTQDILMKMARKFRIQEGDLTRTGDTVVLEEGDLHMKAG